MLYVFSCISYAYYNTNFVIKKLFFRKINIFNATVVFFKSIFVRYFKHFIPIVSKVMTFRNNKGLFQFLYYYPNPLK